MGERFGEHDDDREDHGGRAHDGCADQHRFGRRLEGVARAVVFFEEVLGLFEVHIDAVVLFDLRLGDVFDERQFVDRLSVVGDRAIGIDRDGHRPHSQEAEGDQAEGEHRRRFHETDGRELCAHQVADRHQDDDRDAHPEGAEVSRHEPRKDVE